MAEPPPILSDSSIPAHQCGMCSFSQDLNLNVFLGVFSLPITSATRSCCFSLHLASCIQPTHSIPTNTSFFAVLPSQTWTALHRRVGGDDVKPGELSSSPAPILDLRFILFVFSNGYEREMDHLIIFKFLLDSKTPGWSSVMPIQALLSIKSS